MQFNESSNNTGIVQDVNFICGTDSTSFPVADIARLSNRWYYKAVTDIFMADHRWIYDDSNQTNLPIVTTTLVDGQQDYTLPTGHLQIHAVEVLDNGGNWHRLTQKTVQEQTSTVTDYQTSDGLPREYYFIGNSIFLEPAPASGNVTTTNGLKFIITREIDAFTAADTTQEPGFDEPFHRIIPLGVSYEWLLINGDQKKADRIRSELEQMRTELKNYYRAKNRDVKTRFQSSHERYRGEYR